METLTQFLDRFSDTETYRLKLVASYEDGDDKGSFNLSSAMVASLREPHIPGATCFIRCAECETLYRAESALNWSTGKWTVAWFKPRPIRNPKPCKHMGAVERWDGTAWVDCGIIKD